jgi:phosphatidylserine decarboxylase
MGARRTRCWPGPRMRRSHVILSRMADTGAQQPETSLSSSPPAEANSPSMDAENSLHGVRRALLVLLHLLPKNAMSRLMGRFASYCLPGPLQRAEIRIFAKLAGVDLSEMRDSIESFASLQQFFTRALRPGARPIEGDPSCLVSPCDGAWGESGRIESGTLLQVKGRPYRVAELLGSEELASVYEGGCYATFYLSPRDYHRFHTPTAGSIVRLDYYPGALWPVNSIGLQGVDRLFARNERICAYLQPAEPVAPDAQRKGESRVEGDSIALVAVGATMVGSVKLAFSGLSTNLPGGAPVHQKLGRRARAFARGEEWGHFEFGSTIVMLTPPGEISVEFQPLGTPLRLGEAIGRFGAAREG